MAILTTIPDGAKYKDVRDTLNRLLTDVAALKGGGVVVTPTPTPTAGATFALNGSTNTKLKAMLARVAAGTGRGKIIMAGDSTTVGQGGGSTADSYGLTGARANRPAAVLAQQLTGIGYPAIDGSFVADNGLGLFTSVPLSAYDSRVALGSPPWVVASDQAFAGGGLLQNGAGGVAMFTPSEAVNSFELVYYNAQSALLEFAIDGGVSAIASGPTSVQINAGSGFGKVAFTTTTKSVHALWFATQSGARRAAVASVTAFDSTVAAIDIKVPAALGATASNQATSGGGWSALEYLLYEAPGLSIINLGLNDLHLGVSIATYRAKLQALVAAARVSGDALLVYPHPASDSFAPLTTQQAYRDAAAGVAQDAGVAFLSLFDHFGGEFTPELQDRMFDGLVHGKAGLYAEVGQVYCESILAMAA